MTQFTANEVRDYLFSIEERSSRQWLIAHDTELGMLRQFADLLEAQEKAVPIYQLMATDDSWWDVSRELYEAEGSHAGRTRILYTHPAPSYPERLAEALERTARHRAAADRIDPDQWRSVLYSWEDRALAAHSAQAQPPAARVTDEMVDAALTRAVIASKESGIKGPTRYMMRAALEAALAAQENPNG